MNEEGLHPATDWVEIRRVYEESTETLKLICERFGITKGQLEYRQNKEHWRARRQTLQDRQNSTLARLFVVLEQQVEKLARADNATLGDKEAQQLSELIRACEKLSTLARVDTKDETSPPRRDIKELRAKLVKRLEQFNRR